MIKYRKGNGAQGQHCRKLARPGKSARRSCRQPEERLARCLDELKDVFLAVASPCNNRLPAGHDITGDLRCIKQLLQELPGKLAERQPVSDSQVADGFVPPDKAAFIAEIAEAVQTGLAQNQTQLVNKVSDLLRDVSSLLTKSDFENVLNDQIGQIEDITVTKKDLETQLGTLRNGIEGSYKETIRNTNVDIIKILETANYIYGEITEKQPDVITKLDNIDSILDKVLPKLDKASDAQATASQLAKVESAIHDANKLIGDLDDRLSKFEDENNALRVKIDDLSGKNKSLESENANYKIENDQLKRRINQIEDANRNLAKAKDSLEVMARQLREDLDAQQKQIRVFKAVSDDRDASRSKLSKWENAARIYDAARKSLAACDLFREVGQKYGLVPDTDEGLVTTMKRMGWRDVLDDMYAIARASKERSKQPLTAAEKQAYAAINACYRDAWGVDFDVFQLPGKQNMTDDFQKCAFDKKEMFDLTFPRDNYDYAAEVYVPILRTPAGEIARPGIVKGTH